MKDFKYWDNLSKSEKLEEFSSDKLGLLWLKTKSIIRIELVKKFLEFSKLKITSTKQGQNFIELFGLLAKDLNKGFISNGKDTSVTIFDLTTLAVIAKIKITGKNPDAILYDPFSQKVFVYNGRSSNATVIDAKANTNVATIELPGKPEFAVTDFNGKI